MKVLAPSVTCVVTSHMKPYLRGCLESLTVQTRRDFEAVVVDSGQWIGRTDPRSLQMAAIHADYHSHPLIDWVTTGEQANLHERACPSPWAVNQAIRNGLVRGRYMCILSDDDIYKPRFMEAMAGFLDTHPESLAVWCSMDIYRFFGGERVRESGIHAQGAKTAGEFDCQVDGIQVMYRAEVLSKWEDPWLREDPSLDVCRHADGIWLERVAAVAGHVPGLSEVLCEHQRTPLSTYAPS